MKNFIKKNNLLSQLNSVDVALNNNFYIVFDETYKVTDYNYSLSGDLKKVKLY